MAQCDSKDSTSGVVMWVLIIAFKGIKTSQESWVKNRNVTDTNICSNRPTKFPPLGMLSKRFSQGISRAVS